MKNAVPDGSCVCDGSAWAAPLNPCGAGTRNWAPMCSPEAPQAIKGYYGEQEYRVGTTLFHIMLFCERVCRCVPIKNSCFCSSAELWAGGGRVSVKPI